MRGGIAGGHGRAAARAACALLASALFLHAGEAGAEVWVKDYAAFRGADGTVWAAGAVRSTEELPAVATVEVTARGAAPGGGDLRWAFEHRAVPPGGELPFKFALSLPPRLEGPRPGTVEVSVAGHAPAPGAAPPVRVVYDKSMRVHPDGHATGTVVNDGEGAAEGIRILAVAHGRGHEVLDVAASPGPLPAVGPGESAAFAVYPDPSVGPRVWYYSCFAITDDSVITLNARRDGGPFPIRYDSGLLVSYPRFSEDGRSLLLHVNPGWPMQTSLNLEFPKYSDAERFEVLLGGERVDSLQSVDEAGNWHVAFAVEDQYSGTLELAGFDPGAPAPLGGAVPGWVRDAAGEWSRGLAGDEEFLAAVRFLAAEGALDAPRDAGGGDAVPGWARIPAGWWSQGLLSDAEFLAAAQYLLSSGAMRIAAPAG